MRVAVTTDRFDRVAPFYREARLDPIRLPCVKVEPAPADVLARARAATARAGVIVLSSARTVDLLWPDGPMPSIPVLAVGTATEAAVKDRRGQVFIVGNSGLAALAARARTRLATANVVFPRSANSDRAALRIIRELAPHLLEFEVYRTRSIAPAKAEVQAVAFASPSAVEGWHFARSLEGLVVGVIGPTTSAAVSLHRRPDVVASSPSHRALAQALASHMEVKI
ncbi:MAG TPA: uroporphyrinogen-III synthase [Acidimicrobiia bacterium]|nr:uroporphyrinogen-III synthase [Acidimicrobiia bacterium]